MSNLYTVPKSVEDVARHFGAGPPAGIDAAAEVFPGALGLVVREQDGRRMLQPMTWGFPLMPSFQTPESKPRPANVIADLGRNTWKGLAAKPQSRCLIPMNRFAEPQGPKGAKTRTWVAVRDHPLIAWGGLWHDSPEWGPVYAGVTTDSNTAMVVLHERMPVLLLETEWDTWLGGSFDDLLALQEREFPNELIEMERTAQPWIGKKDEAS